MIIGCPSLAAWCARAGLVCRLRLNPDRLCEDFGLVFFRGYNVRQLRGRYQEVFLAHDKISRVEAGELESMAVGDGVGRACFDTVSTEDATVVVDVVDLGVTLGTGDALGFGVVCRFDVDAVGGAGRGTKEAGDTLFEAVLVALELVLAAKTLLKFGSAHGTFAVGVVFDLGGLEDLFQGNARSLDYSCGVIYDRYYFNKQM